jgi:D-glycero-D-manno-heptose 1,7-bisphosphate phosphatase
VLDLLDERVQLLDHRGTSERAPARKAAAMATAMASRTGGCASTWRATLKCSAIALLEILAIETARHGSPAFGALDFRTRLYARRTHDYCYHNEVVNSANRTLPRVLGTVFLDRDGVLNEKKPESRYVTSWSEFDLLAGVAEAIGRLNRAGLRVVVVSNQRGIALGLYTGADVQAVHSGLQNLLKTHNAHVDGFYFCPHDKEQCNCRKPLPGLFEQAVAEFPEIRAETSAMIGDSLSDIEFGHRLGMLAIFIAGDTERQKPGAEAAAELADLRFPSLVEAVDALLANLSPAKQAS